MIDLFLTITVFQFTRLLMNFPKVNFREKYLFELLWILNYVLNFKAVMWPFYL